MDTLIEAESPPLNLAAQSRFGAATLKQQAKSQNQDAVATVADWHSPHERRMVLLVADGLGSSKGAELASQFIVSYLQEELLKVDLLIGDKADICHALLQKAQQQFLLKLHATEDLPISHESYQTTVIAVIETGSEFIIMYLGNGAAYHLRGHQLLMPDYLPWYTVNLLNPHTIPQGGKEALYKYFSPTASVDQLVPGVITISKEEYSGDIVLICSDGLGSQDSTIASSAANGARYVAHNEVLAAVTKELKQAILAQEFSSDDLTDLCESFLASRIEEAREDDVSLAITITHPAVAYVNKYGQPQPQPKVNTVAAEAPPSSDSTTSWENDLQNSANVSPDESGDVDPISLVTAGLDKSEGDAP